MSTSKQGIAATRKKLEAQFDLIARTTLSNMEAYFNEQKERMKREFDDALLLQAQLPGFDLGQWETAQNFTFEWPFDRGNIFAVKIGDKEIAMVIAVPKSSYQGFILWRRVEAKKE